MHSSNLCIHGLFFFFFNDTATTEIYTLSLHDALPISSRRRRPGSWTDSSRGPMRRRATGAGCPSQDRKSTRLNSSHSQISYAVFSLKKKNQEAQRSAAPSLPEPQAPTLQQAHQKHAHA